MSRNIESRLEKLEEAMTPKPGTLNFELHWRDRVEPDEEVTRISNYFPRSEPEPWNKDWFREPGESYEDFRQRALDDVMANLRPGSNSALFYEYGLRGADYESY